MANRRHSRTHIANIGHRERRRRLVGGALPLALGVGLVAALVATSSPVWWRLGSVAPFIMASFGYFQAREKT